MIEFETRLDFPISSLQDLIAPVTAEDFLSNYWLKSHLYCPGPIDKFSSLISWTVVNRMLEHHWRETYRFRLLRRGTTVPFDSYADRGVPEGTPKVRSRDLTDLLRSGATLDFDAIDELHPPLNELARSLELFFRGSSKINIYAGWKKSHGLDLHRDDQDNFILQIYGHKRWLFYGHSIVGIDKSELARSSEPPLGAVFDELIKPGDLLYIPRGCYHLAIPQNEPTLHLTVSVKNRLGKHLLQWILDQVSSTGIGSRDVPRFAEKSEQLHYIDELKEKILDFLAPDLLDRYFYDVDVAFKARPTFSLPWSATPEGLPPGDNFRIKLTVGRYLTLEENSAMETLEFSCHGRQWRFPKAMKDIIEHLNGDRSMLMNNLVELAVGRLNESTIRLLVGMLVKSGLASIEICPVEQRS